MHPVLSLSAEQGIVVFEYSGNSSDPEWKEVLDFWQQYSLSTGTESQLMIPLGDFYSKRAWIEIYWLQKSRGINVDESLTVGIRESEKQTEEFNQLLGRAYTSPEQVQVEIDELNLSRKLTSDQTRNVSSMISALNGANFSVPGAGKTATQLTVFQLLKARGTLQRMLVVCPKSSFEAWLSEPSEVFENPPVGAVYDGGLIGSDVDFLIVNFEKLESAKRRKALIAWMSQNGGTNLVIDEAHRVKSGARGTRWRACIELASFASRVDLLSGTPMPQSYDDLRNLFSLSWRGVPQSKLNDQVLSSLTPGGLFVRTTKSQLGLPEIKIQKIQIEPGPIQSEVYSALKNKYMGILAVSTKDQLTLSKKGRAVMTLIATASNPALISGKEKDDLLSSIGWPPKELESMELMPAIRDYLRHEIPPKFEWLVRFAELASLEQRKTLVWTSFVGNIELLRKYLKKHNPAIIYGSVSPEDRASELERFRNDPDCTILITNAQTLGEGISLHKTAHEAVFLDRTYNAAQYLQALDRIHRLGLSPDQLTTIYILETRGTIDERVRERLLVKIQRLSEMLNDGGLVKVSLPSTEEEQSVHEALGFDDVDIEDLLTHLSEA